MMTTIKSLLLLFTLALLSACAATPNTNDSAAQENVTAVKPKKEASTRPFPTQTLYSLLVAEIAGQRKRYDIFLGNYMQQAHQTRDPNVAARATQIARYLKAEQAALDASLLWADISPDNTEAQHIAAIQLAKADRLEEAAHKIELLLAKGAEVQSQSITLIATKANPANRDKYHKHIDKLLILYPDNLPLLLSKALLLQSERKNEAALAYAKQALKLEDHNFQATILVANLLDRLDKRPDAIKILEKALRHDPKNDRIRMQYARFLSNFDGKKAEEQFTLLLSKSPNNPNLMLSLALIKKDNGSLEQAKQLFEKLLEINKLTSAANYYLGTIAEEEKRLDNALAHYEKVDGEPDVFAALTRHGKILLKRNDLTRYADHFSKVKHQLPQHRSRLYLLEAELLIEFDHHQLAYNQLTTALAANSTDSTLLYARSMVSEQMNDIDAVERDLRVILSTNPNNADALNALGYTLANKTDRYQEAKALIEKALSIRPNDPAIIDSMGWVEFRLGNYEASLLRLRTAFAEFPDHEVAAHLGEVLWSVKQYNEAKKVWRQGLQLNPNSKIIPEAIKRLVPEEDIAELLEQVKTQ